MFKKFLKFLKINKIVSGIILIGLILLGYFIYYKIFKNNTNQYYEITQLKKGEITSLVSGSGKISALNSFSIKSKINGEVLYILAKDGQEIKSGDLILKLDSKDLEKQIRDAELALENAKIELEKFNQEYNQQLRGDLLEENYEKGLNLLSNLYDEFPTILNNLKKIFFNKDFSENKICNIEGYDFELEGCNISYYSNVYSDNKFKGASYRIKNLYLETKDLYKSALDDYETAKKTKDNNRLNAIKKGYLLSLKTSEMVKMGKDIIRSIQNYNRISNTININQSLIDEHEKDITEIESSIDNYLNNLLSIINSINNQLDKLANYEIDRKNKELNIKQKENNLFDLKDKMKDYFIYAPFDGIIDKINVDKSDFVSSGTILGTIITKNKIADISFNEIDIAKIKVGQEAILTFDAFDNLKIKGKVIEISTTGTEEQGVVSYNAKISIEEDNQDIKPGMSVNADIIVNKKENVLMVPNLAIREDKNGQYVEVIKDSKLKEKKLIKNADISQDLIKKRYIKTGIYDNEFTEVLDGLNENDNIIIKKSNQKININNQKTNPFLPSMPFGQQRR